jgi:hypothetical protein
MEKMQAFLKFNSHSYILANNVVEIRLANGNEKHSLEVRVIGDSQFIPIQGKATDLDEFILILP